MQTGRESSEDYTHNWDRAYLHILAVFNRFHLSQTSQCPEHKSTPILPAESHNPSKKGQTFLYIVATWLPPDIISHESLNPLLLESLSDHHFLEMTQDFYVK